jgi:hypothetical protein
MLGQIPLNALAVGVATLGTNVTLMFQMSEISEADQEDIDSIVSDFGAETLDVIDITVSCTIVAKRTYYSPPEAPVDWIWSVHDPVE